MEENKTESTEQPTANPGNGVQPQADNVVDRADAAAKRIEEGIKAFEQLVIRNERATARQILSGRAEAGTVTKTPEEVEKEKVDAMVKDAMFKSGYRR